MTRYFPDQHDKILRHLFQCKMSDEQIAERMDMQWRTIQRHRQRLGLGMPKGRIPTHKPPEEQMAPLGPEPTSPVQIAKQVLFKRVTEKNGGYFLDGNPISAPNMVREANRVLLERGRNQVGPPEWQVKP